MCTIVLAASASYLQGALVALSSHFGPDFLQQVISGQGAIGVAVAVIQFVAAYAAAKPSAAGALLVQPSTGSAYSALAVPPHPPSAIRASAFHFFLAVGAFAFLGCVAITLLARFDVYRMVHARDAQAAKEGEPPSVWRAERKIRHLGLAVAGVFAVTLSVFPGVTATILSAPGGGREPAWLRLPAALEEPALFIPLVFGVFAAGDWIGRLLPQVQCLVFTDWRGLMGATVARVVFIVRVYSHTPILFSPTGSADAIPHFVPFPSSRSHSS